MAAIHAVHHKVIGSRQLAVTYRDRISVRVVVFNATGEVALMRCAKEDYYKLPGGGVEPGEDQATAAQRELLEETGCLIRLRDGGCFATTEEFRRHNHQVSFCYRADLVEDTGRLDLTEEELEDELTCCWMPAVEARRVMDAAVPTSEFGRFVRERDLWVLDRAVEDQSGVVMDITSKAGKATDSLGNSRGNNEIKDAGAESNSQV